MTIWVELEFWLANWFRFVCSRWTRFMRGGQSSPAKTASPATRSYIRKIPYTKRHIAYAWPLKAQIVFPCKTKGCRTSLVGSIDVVVFVVSLCAQRWRFADMRHRRHRKLVYFTIFRIKYTFRKIQRFKEQIDRQSLLHKSRNMKTKDSSTEWHSKLFYLVWHIV